MDFNDEDELDFEEDLPENETRKIDEHENAEREKVEYSDMNESDQYLQIDCLEDEEDLLSKIPLETEKSENTVHEKGASTKDPMNEENEKSEEKEKFAEKKEGENIQNSKVDKVNWKRGKERPFGVPLYRTPGSVRSNRWRSDKNFMRLARQNIGQRSNHLKGFPLQYPKLHHFSQNYFQNQNDFVSLLGLNAAKNQNLDQINHVLAQYSNSMLEVRKNLFRNGLLGQCSNAILNRFQYNDFSRFQGALEQKLAADAIIKNFPVRSMNGFKPNYNRGSSNEGPTDKSLPGEEKELVKSKKEARLLRFMNQEAARQEVKPTENISEKPTIQNLNLEDEYFRKMEEQKRKRQEIFSLKQKQNQCYEKSPPEALAINKELLLRKENPFENSSNVMGNSIKFEVKQEKEEIATVNQNGNSVLTDLCSVKKEVEPPVKFVRTVSKSFEELGLSKTKNGLLSRNNGNELDILVGSDSLFEYVPKAGLVDTASQTQTEPHLTGCIVKVLNLPPSTTTNEVLDLCSSLGTVKEVKLNFPVENSVAIRFAEPKSAESFFKLYNGRAIGSHILNVITV